MRLGVVENGRFRGPGPSAELRGAAQWAVGGDNGCGCARRRGGCGARAEQGEGGARSPRCFKAAAQKRANGREPRTCHGRLWPPVERHDRRRSLRQRVDATHHSRRLPREALRRRVEAVRSRGPARLHDRPPARLWQRGHHLPDAARRWPAVRLQTGARLAPEPRRPGEGRARGQHFGDARAPAHRAVRPSVRPDGPALHRDGARGGRRPRVARRLAAARRRAARRRRARGRVVRAAPPRPQVRPRLQGAPPRRRNYGAQFAAQIRRAILRQRYRHHRCSTATSR